MKTSPDTLYNAVAKLNEYAARKLFVDIAQSVYGTTPDTFTPVIRCTEGASGYRPRVIAIRASLNNVSLPEAPESVWKNHPLTDLPSNLGPVNAAAFGLPHSKLLPQIREMLQFLECTQPEHHGTLCPTSTLVIVEAEHYGAQDPTALSIEQHFDPTAPIEVLLFKSIVSRKTHNIAALLRQNNALPNLERLHKTAPHSAVNALAWPVLQIDTDHAQDEPASSRKLPLTKMRLATYPDQTHFRVWLDTRLLLIDLGGMNTLLGSQVTKPQNSPNSW